VKTAYELAMERLSKSSPAVKLTAQQKRALADLDSRYLAKLAERELALQEELAKTEASGDVEAMGKARQQHLAQRRKLQAELEEKKEQVRQAKA
jgi:hypothetical protein